MVIHKLNVHELSSLHETVQGRRASFLWRQAAGALDQVQQRLTVERLLTSALFS